MRRILSGLLVVGILSSAGIALGVTPAQAAGMPPPPGWRDCIQFASWESSNPYNEHFPCTSSQWDLYFDYTQRRVAAGYASLPEAWEFTEFEQYWDSFPGDMSDWIDHRRKWMLENDAAINEDRKPGMKSNPKPFTPSTSKPRAFMINVLGSVLKGATPDKWKRELLANQHQYNHSWEGLSTQFGTNPANPNYTGKPASYEDYVLKHHEMDQKGGKNGKKMTAPATKTSPFRKAVGAAGSAAMSLTMMPIGFSIGNAVTTAFGFDPDAGVCTQDDSIFRDIMASISGADCSAFALDPSYEPNTDGGQWSGRACNGAICADLIDLRSGAYKSGPFAGNKQVVIRRTGDPVSTFTLSVRYVLDDKETQTSAVFRTSEPGLSGHPVYGWPMLGSAAAQRSTMVGICLVGCGAVGSQAGWSPVVLSDADPERSLTCTIEADNGSSYTMTSKAYRESSGATAAAECPGLPEGVRPTNVAIKENGPSGSKPVWDQDVTPEYAAWWDNYPECRTGACKLDLLLKPGTGAPAIASCFDASDQCVSWFEQPNKEDLYQCRYGVHDVTIDECAVYAGVFKPERLTVGAPYSDPETGEWSGGQSSPSAANDMMNSPLQNPDAARECWTKGWAAFNPVEWVLAPIRCGLEWAFVPRPTVVMAEGAKVSNGFNARAPGQIAALVGSWSFDVSMTGCKIIAPWAPSISGAPGQLTQTPLLDVCPGSPAEILGTISKVVTSVGFGVLVFLATRRYISGAVDYR